jgi:hypothetical protein
VAKKERKNCQKIGESETQNSNLAAWQFGNLAHGLWQKENEQMIGLLQEQASPSRSVMPKA